MFSKCKTIKDDLENIKAQPFIKVYATIEGLNSDEIPYVTVLKSRLQKITPINPEKHVYMISFTDNANAKYLKSKTKTFFENELKRLFERDVKIIDMKKFYWKEGTHYYKPLPSKFKSRNGFIKKIQYPSENVYIIGELISSNQGWTEGALESVLDIVKLLN